MNAAIKNWLFNEIDAAFKNLNITSKDKNQILIESKKILLKKFHQLENP